MKYISEHQFVDGDDKIAFDHIDLDSLEAMLKGEMVFGEEYFIVPRTNRDQTLNTPQTFGEVSTDSIPWLIYMNRDHGFTAHVGPNIYGMTFGRTIPKISHEHGNIPEEYSLRNDSKVIFGEQSAEDVESILDKIQPNREKILGYAINLPYEVS